MSERIEPSDSATLLRRSLGNEYYKYFTQKEEGEFVAEARTEKDLQARVTLKPDRDAWQLMLELQTDKHYDSLVVTDFAPLPAGRKMKAEIEAYLRMHGVELVSGPEGE
jgi:hypothetical protein